MKIIILSLIFLFCLLSTSATSAELVIKDKIPCKYFISAVNDKNSELVKDLFQDSLEHLTYEGFGITKYILDDFEKSDGNIKNPGSVTFYSFEITQQSMQIISPKFLYEQCQENPNFTVEYITRSIWLAVQSQYDNDHK